MDKFRPTFGVEPTDKYAKARQDVMQALNSMRELEPWQREQLAKELFGVEKVAAMYHIMQQYFGCDE